MDRDALTDEQRRLVEAYVPLADKCVNASRRTLSRYIETDELRSVAYEALVQSASSFDPSRGATFASYAWRRMTGAMLDHQRTASTLRRRKGKDDAPKDYAALRFKGGKGLELPRRVPPTQLVSLETPPGYGENTATLGEVIPGESDIGEALCASDFVGRMMWAVPARERFVLLALDAGYTQGEVADMLGVTESRISQLRTKALGRMKWLLDGT